MKRLEWKIAMRYMRGRRPSGLVSLITFIAVSGVVVGVLALVIVMGVMNGLQTELRDRILIGSPHLQVFTYGSGLRVDDWKNALRTIRGHPDVVAAAPFVMTAGLVSAGYDFADPVYVLGIEPDTGAAAVTELAQHFVRGDLEFATESDDVLSGIVLGERVADRLGAFQGDRLNIVSPAGSGYNRAVGSIVPRIFPFEVTGTFSTGMYEYDQNYVILPLEAAQQFAALDTAVSGIQVRVDDPWRATEIGNELVTSLGLSYRVVDWQTQNFGLFSALKLEKLAMALILTLIIIVAAFNIISTLTMVVADKTREIGILRAMGLSARSVRKVFVLQGAFVGCVGTAIGASVGFIVAKVIDSNHLIAIPAEVYFIDHLPVKVEAVEFILIVLMSITVATLATLYPARQAARFTPVDAIRHE